MSTTSLTTKEVAQYFLELKSPGEILITIFMHNMISISVDTNIIIPNENILSNWEYETVFILINV